MKTNLLAVFVLLTGLILPAHARWPSENELTTIFGSRKHAAAIYYHKIVFYNLPGDLELKKKPGASSTLRIFSGSREVPLKELKPAKVLRFNHSFQFQPLFLSEPREAPFLVCLTPDLDQSPNGRPDRSLHNPDAKDQFCGVIAPDGTIVFEFPVEQKPPETVARALGIRDDGKRAAIVIGERVTIGGEDGKSYDLGSPREVLIWEHPDKLSRAPAKKFRTPYYLELMRMFWSGKL